MSDFPKRCSMCHRYITESEWEKLPCIGHQVTPPWPEENDPGEVLELRNCGCNSTLSIQEPFTAEELEMVAAQELERLEPGAPGAEKLARQLAIRRLKRR